MKKIISVVLCLAMVLSMASCVFAENKKTINYVSLGASQTWGLGACNVYPEQFSKWTGSEEDKQAWDTLNLDAPAWNPEDIKVLSGAKAGYSFVGVGAVADTSFPYLVKTEIEKQGYNVNFSQLASSGTVAQDLVCFLQNEYTIDGIDYFIENNFSTEAGMENLSLEELLNELRLKYQTAVKEADFITYDIGEMDVTMGLIKVFSAWNTNNKLSNPDYEHILKPEDYEKFKIIREYLSKEFISILDECGVNETTSIIIHNFIDNEAFGILSYCCGLDTCMELIYDLNPDVNVCVLQIQNFYAGLNMCLNGIEIPIGDMLQIVIDIVNTYASSFSQYHDSYYYSVSSENQRVEFNTDIVKNYSGPEDITDVLISLLDVHDVIYDIHIKSMLTPEYEKVNGRALNYNETKTKTYNDTLNACYDATLKLFSYIFNNYTATISGMMSADVNDVKPVINTMLGEVADAFINGNGDYSIAIEHAKENYDKLPEEDKGAISLLLYTQFGSTALMHPSIKGQQQMAQGVINAMKDSNTGMKSMLGGIVFSAKSIKKSVNSIADCIDEIVASIVKDPVGFVTSIVPEETLKTVIKKTVQEKLTNTFINIYSKMYNNRRINTRILGYR